MSEPRSETMGALAPGGEREPRGPVPRGACVEVLQGFYAGLRVPLDRPWIVLGRGRGAEVVLSEPTLSRAHAAIGFDGETFFVRDLGSTNGTLVNGVRESEHALDDGDEIQIGRLALRFQRSLGAGAPG